MVTINAVAFGPLLIALFLSLALGAAIGVLGKLALGFGEIALGIAEAVAGGRASYKGTSYSKAPILFRAVIYFIAIVGSIVLMAVGYPVLAYVLAIGGGIAFPIAIVRLLG